VNNTEVKFADLPFSEEVQKALADMGFEKPSPIQQSAIPFILEGKDLIGQAQTGTGKTAAFAIPTIEMINPEIRGVQALIMCPTRELAIQVAEEFKKLSKYKRNIKCLPVYGGTSIDKQIQVLRQGVQIIIGTPGRIMDHIDRGTLKLDQVQMVILDEADEMLNMGFIDDIESILSDVPEERQTVFFSATMPKPILDLTKKFQKNPEIIKISKSELTVTNIEQFYFEVRSPARTEAMCRLVDMYGLKLMLVFCNTKRAVDGLVEELQMRNMQAEAIHGDLRQQQRNNVLAKFKGGVINILVATDVAARGIDVDSVDAVFNYDIPMDDESYVHRIGRTGRAGKSGRSFTFVTGRKDSLKLKDILHYTKASITKGEVPTQEEIETFRKKQFVEKITNLVYADELKDFIPAAEELINSGIAAKSIIAALIKLNIGTTAKAYSDENFKMEDRGPSRYDRDGDRGGDRGGRRDRFERGGERSSFDRGGDRFERGGDRGGRFERGGDRDRGGDKFDRSDRGGSKMDMSNMVKVFINIGRNQRIGPGDIVGAIAGESGINGKNIGDIDIKDKHTFVYLAKEDVNKVVESMTGNSIKGFKISLEVAKP
jgi:ATP-dependent RNA helicase DeaD